MSADQHQAPVVEQQRVRGMLELLQQSDPDIEQIVVYSKFVVTYLLQQDGANPGWRKSNKDGPVYVVRRRTAPRYRLLVKNQFSTSDLEDDLHPDWELDCQKNYVFYKVEDPTRRIRGLWFHDDQERQKVEQALEDILEQLREPVTEPAIGSAAPPPQGFGGPAALAAAHGMGNLIAQRGAAMAQPGAAQESATITMSSLQGAWRAMADDEEIMRSLMQKLREASAHV